MIPIHRVQSVLFGLRYPRRFQPCRPRPVLRVNALALLVQPAAALDELGAEVAEMRDGPAKGGQAQPQERDQDLGRAGSRSCTPRLTRVNPS